MSEPARAPTRPPPAAVPPGRRVLIITAGTSPERPRDSDRTATVLAEAVERLWPSSEIRRLRSADVLGAIAQRLLAVNPMPPNRHYRLADALSASMWRHRRLAATIGTLTGFWCGRRLAEEVDRFDPDLILSTYPPATSGLGWLHRHRGLQVTTAAWVPDFAPSPATAAAAVDTTFVQHEAALPAARAATTPSKAGRFAVSAFHLVDAPSAIDGEQASSRAGLGLGADSYVVVVAPGPSTAALADTVRCALDSSALVQAVAICGPDEVTRRRLESWGEPPERLLTVGAPDQPGSLLAAAAVVVTAPGTAVALQAVTAGTPVVMLGTAAGQRKADADLLVASGLADLCTTTDQLRSYLQSAALDNLAEPRLTDEDRIRTGGDVDTGLLRLGPTAQGVATSTAWPVRPGDAFFAHVETDTVRQELGTVLHLDPVEGNRPVTLSAVREQIGARTPHLPPLRRRLVRRRRPGWVLHDAVQVEQHIVEHRVPADASDEDMLAVIGDYWSGSMPAGQPGWHMLLVHGQASGRSMFAIKLHHSHGDGISALGLLDRLLTPAADDKLLQRRPTSSGAAARRDVKTRVGTAGGATVTLAKGLWSLATRSRPGRFALNRRAGSRDRQIVVVPLPWAELRTVARKLGGRPHELAIAVVADGLARALRPTGLVPPAGSLRVMVPVAMRTPRLDRIAGNWTGTVAVDLPLAPTPPRDLVAHVRREVDSRVHRGEPQAAEAVMGLVGRLPASAHRAFARAVYNQRFFHTIVSYMPGARGARWCAGARVRAYYPVLPLAPGVPVTVGIIVGDAVAGVGIFADRGLGLESTALTAAVEQAFAAAVEAAG